MEGIKNGFVKEYKYYGQLLFKGEYKEWKRNGKGKEYDYCNGKLQYDGEYLKGK